MKIIHIIVTSADLNESDAKANRIYPQIKEQVLALGGTDTAVGLGFGSQPAIIVAEIPESSELELTGEASGLEVKEWHA